MSLPTLSRDEVRDVDRAAIEEFGVPGIVLMENAGRNAAEFLLSRNVSGPVIICCGKGNNGGDGFVMVRHLDNAGVDVRVLLSAEPDALQGDAAINCRIVQKSGIRMTVFPGDVQRPDIDAALRDAQWIVDALLGTGTAGPVREPLLTVIAAINESGARVFAVDLPSGLDCNRGEPLGACVRAEATATFVARKTGFDAAAAKEWIGDVRVIDIGIPRVLRERVLGGEW